MTPVKNKGIGVEAVRFILSNKFKKFEAIKSCNWLINNNANTFYFNGGGMSMNTPYNTSKYRKIRKEIHRLFRKENSNIVNGLKHKYGDVHKFDVNGIVKREKNLIENILKVND
jgi:hypothetical protein